MYNIIYNSKQLVHTPNNKCIIQKTDPRAVTRVSDIGPGSCMIYYHPDITVS